MTIYSIKRNLTPGQTNIVFLQTDSSPEEFCQGGWLGLASNQADIISANNGTFTWQDNDTILVSYPSGTINLTTGREVFASTWMSIFPSFLSLNPNPPIYPTLPLITAHAGGGQTNAVQLNLGVNSITTVATTGDSVKLPDDVLGQTVLIHNVGANSADVFPFLGDTINSLAVNTAISIPAGSRGFFFGSGVTSWGSIIQP